MSYHLDQLDDLRAIPSNNYPVHVYRKVNNDIQQLSLTQGDPNKNLTHTILLFFTLCCFLQSQ